LALAVAGANRHDVSQLEAVLDSVVIERPDIFERPQHLCLGKGFTGEPALETAVLRGFIPHIKSRGEEKTGQKQNPEYKARRRVVEVTRSWINRLRKLPVRFEKPTTSYLGLLMFAVLLLPSVKQMLFRVDAARRVCTLSYHFFLCSCENFSMS
jgi:hypothetical protein